MSYDSSLDPLASQYRRSGGINLFRIYSNRSIYIERTQFIHLEKIARDYEQVVSRTLHVVVGCSVGLSFSNMKNKKQCHIVLHLVHNPTL